MKKSRTFRREGSNPKVESEIPDNLGGVMSLFLTEHKGNSRFVTSRMILSTGPALRRERVEVEVGMLRVGAVRGRGVSLGKFSI
jgi:hypothetical protein